MDEPHKLTLQPSDIKTVLPDVVHSQQISTLDGVDNELPPSILPIEHGTESEILPQSIENISGSESISEHIPSKCDFSISESYVAQDLPQLELKHGPETSSDNSLNILPPQSSGTDNYLTQDASKHTVSSPLDINAVSDIHYLSEESAMSVPIPGTSTEQEIPIQSPLSALHKSDSKKSTRSNYDDSLNEAAGTDKSELSLGVHDSLDISENSISKSDQSDERTRSGSEEIIKLDIRGQGVPKYVMPTDIIFGPPPEEMETFGPNVTHLPVFQNMLSPFLLGSTKHINVKKLFSDPGAVTKDEFPQQSSYSPPEEQSIHSEKVEQGDPVVEEEVEDCGITPTADWVSKNEEIQEEMSMPTQLKSLAAETAPETMSLSTLNTDYKTFCEEYHVKLVHLEDAISRRDQLIEELSISLQQSTKDQEQLKHENAYLTSQIHNLQHLVDEPSQSDHDTMKAQLSDFVRYQNLLKDDSTKFYSALMSGGSSMQSSNGEKDMEREEITVNYSKSDLRTSESSEELQFGFESKIILLMNKFDEYIQENMRNKLREGIIQVLCDEINKMQLEFDTEYKDIKSQMHQDKQAFTTETRRLRELLSSMKTDNVEIEDLRKELAIKHEKEMENLRRYFEKKCTDIERRPMRRYSEDINRGRKCSSPMSDVSGGAGGAGGAGGDCRRSRSAEPSSLVLESTGQELALKQLSRRYEQQLEESRQEHQLQVEELRGKYQQTIEELEKKIRKLQTSEGTEGNMSVYQQDIDLELEKPALFEKRLNEMREEVVQELQEKIQVLLSDPDAEVSSWPVELVALRDKIHGEQHELQLSSVREEGEADKWRQRRNNSFDQNRQLELVTKERDEFRRVAAQLQRAVSQLVSYCARADDELNNTVLACLVTPLLDSDSEAGSPEAPCKRVHFAPTLESPALAALGDLGPECREVGGGAGAREGAGGRDLDLSLDLRRDLELSLSRLKHEARALLDLAMKRAGNESKMLECSQLQVTDLVEELERRGDCDYCDMHKKMAVECARECADRESILREQLQAAELRISQLAEQDVIAEGYGCAAEVGVRSPRSPASPHARDHYTAVIDSLTREKDDLTLQLEAANRQLRSTRQFVEEQAAERESERDDYTRQISTLKQDNQRLTARLQSNARILSEVEQLETQAREMNQLIADMEARKSSVDNDLKASEEKVSLLRDIISNLEQQLEKKTNHEAEVLKELEEMRRTIDERDSKIRSVLNEVDSLRKEKAEQSDMMCVKCGQEEELYADLQQKIEEQCQHLEEALHREARALERAHETCSPAVSENTEDVSIREQKLGSPGPGGALAPAGAGVDGAGWWRVWCALEALLRPAHAALKRVADLEMQRAQLQRVAQEVRAERDVLQARMSSQALQLSSLSARLDRQRAQAAQLAGDTRQKMALQLHDAASQLERLKEEMECKDKQLVRLKQKLEEKEKQTDSLNAVYSNSGNPKDRIIILERELSSAHTRVAQLEALANSLESDKDALLQQVRQLQRTVAERDEQMNQFMALKLDEEQNEKEDVVDVGKASARTLSDIVSISDFDEQDLQMRRAELKGHQLNLSGAPFVNDSRDKSHFHRTPEINRPNISSLNMEYGDHFDLQSFSPRADSLPAHLTSTQNKDLLKEFKRNVNETTVFGNIDKFENSAKQNIIENCSNYPNRDISETKNNTIEPKKIDFSLEPSRDNKYEEDFTSLRELGVTLDIKQENFPDILTQLKHEIKKSRSELERCKSNLKTAEEQLCEFPALKEEVEELKGLLENTMATMNNDKKFYENQLDSFTSNKKSLEQRLNELTKELTDKSNDLQVLKEDILRRENMILELAKEKRNLTNKVSDLELKIDDLENLNTKLENYESENMELKQKVIDLQKLEQLVSEKNQQIDSLNQHLDRLDDMQRSLNDKTDETCNLKEELHNKSNEVLKLLDTVKALKTDIAKMNEENTNLNTLNKDLKQQLTKLEKEQENSSLKLQSNESELSRLNSLNNEMTSKIEELKLLTDKLKDKETEIEMLTEDIDVYHEEIATLKEQLKMISRSPSPRNKTGVERKSEDRQANNDKKQLVKIRKQISLLQHELDFNKKELNDKAFELAKAKLDVTELRNNLSQANKQTSDKVDELTLVSREVERVRAELAAAREDKDRAEKQLEVVVQRLREESNVDELRAKLADKEERCQELELELQDMKEAIERMGFQDNALVTSGRRSPTAELELALRNQINYSHSLDHQIMEQILSASSDEHEDIPRLALGSSVSSSSIQSSSSERAARLRSDNSRLALQVEHLEARLRDKDALIKELNEIRDKLVQDWQTTALRLEAEQDNSSRLKLLLDKHKDTADCLQNQDSNMIEILKKRLESAMRSEMEARGKETELRAIISRLQGGNGTVVSPVKVQVEESALSLARSQLEAERARAERTARDLASARAAHARETRVLREQNDKLVAELAQIKRQKQDACLELVRAREQLAQSPRPAPRAPPPAQVTPAPATPARLADALTELEAHKWDLSREIAGLKQFLSHAAASATSATQRDNTRHDEKDQVIRYLHGRCLRLESVRKALVWQKRYLTRVLEGYAELERELRLPGSGAPRSAGKNRFKCVATAVSAAVRMRFLVRRRQAVRAVSANCILSASKDNVTPSSGGSLRRASLRRTLITDAAGDYGSPFAPSPIHEPFMLSSPRGEVAQAYMNKLNLVSRCLSRAMDESRDVP